MRRFAIIAVSALALAACSEQLDPTGAPGRQNLITGIAGNENTCTPIYDPSCMGPLDHAVKALYEMNNFYANVGEAEYNLASNNNDLLTQITYFSVDSVSARKTLDSYISKVTVKPNGGGYTQCAADALLDYANLIRSKILAGSVDVAWRQPAVCVSALSPVTATFRAGAGVTISAADPYHYAYGTPYNSGNPVQTWYNLYKVTVNGDELIQSTTPFAEPDPKGNPPAVTFTDASALGDAAAAVTYTYRVEQCEDFWDQCSARTSVTITVPAQTTSGGGGGGDQCLTHDNSNHDPATNNNSDKTKCDKSPPGQVKKTT